MLRSPPTLARLRRPAGPTDVLLPRAAFALVLLAGCGPRHAPASAPAASSAAAPATGAHGHDAAAPLGHRFTDPAEWSKRWDDPARDAWQRPADVIAAMGLSPGMTVADVGAGTGYFEPHLSRAVGGGGKVLALDIEPEMVRWVHDRAAREALANVEARLVAADDPGLAPASVHRVLVVDTWHHIAAREAYARKLAAALAPGGAVFVVDFTLDTDKGPPRAERVAPDKVVAELRAAGLAAEVLAESLPDQYVVVGRGAALAAAAGGGAPPAPASAPASRPVAAPVAAVGTGAHGPAAGRPAPLEPEDGPPETPTVLNPCAAVKKPKLEKLTLSVGKSASTPSGLKVTFEATAAKIDGPFVVDLAFALRGKKSRTRAYSDTWSNFQVSELGFCFRVADADASHADKIWLETFRLPASK
ncbi:MAG TPA: class I SAM-dependent methyltransferase [Myxococcota bacterium]|jgi:predicted methyltransferase|nr:class I SAM-dependent methyltransferase [Myxococcota bacterium]